MPVECYADRRLSRSRCTFCAVATGTHQIGHPYNSRPTRLRGRRGVSPRIFTIGTVRLTVHPHPAPSRKYPPLSS